MGLNEHLMLEGTRKQWVVMPGDKATLFFPYETHLRHCETSSRGAAPMLVYATRIEH